jgi:hypothetical protein
MGVNVWLLYFDFCLQCGRGYPDRLQEWRECVSRVGQNRLHARYMAVCALIFLLEILYMHRVYVCMYTVYMYTVCMYGFGQPYVYGFGQPYV